MKTYKILKKKINFKNFILLIFFLKKKLISLALVNKRQKKIKKTS